MAYFMYFFLRNYNEKTKILLNLMNYLARREGLIKRKPESEKFIEISKTVLEQTLK